MPKSSNTPTSELNSYMFTIAKWSEGNGLRVSSKNTTVPFGTGASLRRISLFHVHCLSCNISFSYVRNFIIYGVAVEPRNCECVES